MTGYLRSLELSNDGALIVSCMGEFLVEPGDYLAVWLRLSF